MLTSIFISYLKFNLLIGIILVPIYILKQKKQFSWVLLIELLLMPCISVGAFVHEYYSKVRSKIKPKQHYIMLFLGLFNFLYTIYFFTLIYVFSSKKKIGSNIGIGSDTFANSDNPLGFGLGFFIDIGVAGFETSFNIFESFFTTICLSFLFLFLILFPLIIAETSRTK